MLFGILSAGLVEADALHAPLSDNAPATPNAATAPFRLLPLFLEVRLSPDIGFLQSVSDLASMAFASLWFQDAGAREAASILTTVNVNAITSHGVWITVGGLRLSGLWLGSSVMLC